MATLRPLIMQALKSALEANSAGAMTKPAGLTVHRARHRLIMQESELPAQVLAILQNPNDDRPSGVSDRELHVAVESRVRVVGQAPDDAIDALVSWAETAIRADHTLGGLVMDIEYDGTLNWATDGDSDTTIGQATSVFRIEYRHDWNDPEA